MTAIVAFAFATPETIPKFVRFDRTVTSPALAIVWLAGMTMAGWYGWFGSGWLLAKLPVVVILSAVHGVVSGRLRRLSVNASQTRSESLVLIPAMVVGVAMVVVLAVTKQF
ncbi:CopD family protein [Agrobacterium larrymoorei]|uniref:CopD family protein n=1 Tax=Agrobacterium larrymoorei TaxID=160699 RepID=UPI001F19B459|nr:CopD family protein [Agrobacterium larrymoorei]